MKTKSSSQSKKWWLGLFFIIIAVLMTAVLGLLVKSATKVTPAVISTSPIKAGSIIKPEDVMSIEVGSYNLPQAVITDANQVVGRYALRDIPANELLFSTSITNDYIKRLSEKAKYGAMALPVSTLDTVTGDIKENDFVTILVSMRKNKEQEGYGEATTQLPEVNTALIYTKELAAVRVLGLYDSSGKKYEKGVTDGSPSMIVFDALPVQRILLNQARDNGQIRITILPEYVQNGFRKAWGLLQGTEEELQADEEKITNEIEKNMEENEALESEHMKMSEKDTIGTYVEDEDVIEGTVDDIGGFSEDENSEDQDDFMEETEDNGTEESTDDTTDEFDDIVE